jgi:tetratricopeptide (TPR) repeat protein
MSKKKKSRKPGAGAASPAPEPIATAERPAKRSFARPIWVVSVVTLLIAIGLVRMQYQGAGPVAPTPPAPPATAPVTASAPHYLGAAACAACHQSEHDAWHGSDHDLAMQVADEKSVLGDFNDAKFTYAGTTSTFSQRDGKYFVNTDGPDGALHDYEVGYTFGVHPLQQYLIDFPGGRKQALSIAWDSRPKEQGGQRWFHLYPNDSVKAGDWLHWTNLSQNWNFTCAECHSTDLKKNYDPATNTYETTWAGIDVACEACHGPGSNHVAWAHKEGDWQKHDADKGLAVVLEERRGVTWAPVADTGNATRSVSRQTTREIDMCARCHARASRLTDNYVHGKSPLDSHRLARLDDDLYWHDGQMRGEVYNWGSFVQSRMYAQGVTCSDCHDPHSLKLRAPGNAVCAQCHQPAKYDTTAHTHHAMGTPGAACANCHMPTTTYMVLDPRHDHSMRIPRPDLSAKLGTPDACTNCHARKNAQWAAAAIAKWTGKEPSSYQRFAEALHAGSIGAPGARDALVAVINDPTQPALVRASAIDRIAGVLTPEATGVVVRALQDPDASVRLAAAEALANTTPEQRQHVLPALLTDPVLSVRIEAARALAGAPERILTEAQRTQFNAVLAEYVAVQQYNSDRPEGHMNLGNLAAVRGDANEAIAHYQQAMALDPLFVAAYANLADLYRATGNEVEVQVTLRQGLKADPRSAVLHHTLGLALTREKAREQSLEEFKTAVQLAPSDARFAYVYAVALNDAGQHDDALSVLKTSLKVNPYDVDLLLGLVYFSQQAGDGASAHEYLAQLRELEPGNPELDQLQQQLDAAPVH